MTLERATQPAAVSADASSNHIGSPMAGTSSEEPPLAPANEEVPLVTIKEDDTTTKVTKPSASEEQLQVAVTEQK